jgi:hypothetical protein
MGRSTESKTGKCLSNGVSEIRSVRGMNSNTKHDLSRDRNLVSDEPYEIRYVVDKLSAEFPSIEKGDIHRLVEHAKREVQPSENREDVLNAARRLLSKE